MRNRSVLIVEDDPAAGRYMALALGEEYDCVRTASGGTEALLAMESKAADLAILDLGLPDMDGLELLVLLKQRWPEVAVVFVTAAASIATVVEAVQRGAINYLVKPVAPAVLLAASRKALATSSTLQSSIDPAMPEVIGTSRAMLQVRHITALTARSDVNVLITGDTGTGKELIARAIHRLSRLRERPFVAHNCATTPAEMFDSEFFGHHRGAFTGADRAHVGLLVKASGGVLLLDELESFGLSQQAKLLRVLDDGEVRPVGSSQTQVVSVRFLAATNHDPREMLAAGTLREDLYYRLCGFEIHLPPLRDRREDISSLAAHFLGEDIHRLTSEALVALCEFPWPGNVRQLRKVLDSARTLAGHGKINAHHLGIQPSSKESGTHSVQQPERQVLAGTRSIKELEREAILHALRDFNGNRRRAASALGMHRATLRRKIQQSGIRFPP